MIAAATKSSRAVLDHYSVKISYRLPILISWLFFFWRAGVGVVCVGYFGWQIRNGVDLEQIHFRLASIFFPQPLKACNLWCGLKKKIYACVVNFA